MGDGEEMKIVVFILVIFIILLVAYIYFLQTQLNNINQQLVKRLSKKTKQPISLLLINRELDKLAANINKCLKAEELLRLESIRNEKQFRELITNISHDLRTPLTALKGYQQLMEKGGLTDGQREKLLTARKHANQLGDMIERFFEYAYLISTEQELTIERINLTSLMAECIVEFIPVFEEKNMVIHLEEKPHVFVQADKKMLVRIIQNLIRNCAAYADGNIIVDILTDQNAVILFRNPIKHSLDIDTARLFDRYYAADNRGGKSTGLGLSIVKLLAEQQGGSASASIQDGFFEIKIELPLYVNSR